MYSKGAKFQAVIGHQGRRIPLGTFDTAKLAATAYDRAAVNLFGPGAELNLKGNKYMADTMIPLSEITIDPSFQTRVNLYEEAWVAKIKADLEEDPQANYDKIRVFQLPDGSKLLTRGFNRVEGYKRAGRAAIPAEVIEGDRATAFLDALASNNRHGLQLRDEDRRKKVKMVLQHPDLGKKSVHEIARLTGVNRKTVADVKAQLAPGASKPAAAESVTYTRNGKQQTMKVKNIGKGQKPNEEKKPDTQPPEPEKLTDETGAEVSEALQAVFLARDNFDEAAGFIRHVSGFLNEMKEHPAGRRLSKQAEIDKKNLYAELTHARPHAVCPPCKGGGQQRGKDCAVCGGLGWLNKSDHERFAKAEK